MDEPTQPTDPPPDTQNGEVVLEQPDQVEINPLDRDEVAPGLIPNADERIVPFDDEKGFNLRAGSSPGWFPALVALQGKMLPRYNQSTVLRLGNGTFSELHTNAKIDIGHGITPVMIMELRIQNSNRCYDVATLYFPLDELATNPVVRDIEMTSNGDVVDILRATDFFRFPRLHQRITLPIQRRQNYLPAFAASTESSTRVLSSVGLCRIDQATRKDDIVCFGGK